MNIHRNVDYIDVQQCLELQIVKAPDPDPRVVSTQAITKQNANQIVFHFRLSPPACKIGDPVKMWNQKNPKEQDLLLTHLGTGKMRKFTISHFTVFDEHVADEHFETNFHGLLYGCWKLDTADTDVNV